MFDFGEHPSDAVYERVQAWSDDAWRELLLSSTAGADIDAVPLPTFPREETQTAIHGHANAVSIHEAFLFYQEIKRYAAFCLRPIAPHHTLLDFGCGWGRMLRPFMKDLPGSNIYGCEPDPQLVVVARQHNPYVNLIGSSYLPPLPLGADSFDLVIAWSVFSHLDDFTANKWVVELTRILRPGGLMFLTTEGTAFFGLCERLHSEKRERGELASPWHRALVTKFPDPQAALARYQAGEFVFAGAQPPAAYARYGDTAIPAEYVRAHWGRHLDLIDYVDDSGRLPQALIVLQRPFV